LDSSVEIVKLLSVNDVTRALDNERQIWKNVASSQRKVLREWKHLHDQLHKCSVNKSLQDKCTIDSSSLGDALDLLTTSDDIISALVAEVLMFFWPF
jgi:hypothetical protein